MQLRLSRPSRCRAANGMASDIPSSMVRGLRAIPKAIGHGERSSSEKLGKGRVLASGILRQVNIQQFSWNTAERDMDTAETLEFEKTIKSTTERQGLYLIWSLAGRRGNGAP